MTQDTRKDRRVKIVSLNVRYKSATVDEFIENHSYDVSKGGIFIKTPNPFPPGTLLKFEIRLAGDQAVIAGVGRVVWKRDTSQAASERPAGMGVKFIKLDDSSKAVIDRLTVKTDAGRAYEQEIPTEAPGGVELPAVATSKSSPPRAHTPLGVGAGGEHRKSTMIGIGAVSASDAPPAGASQPPRPGEASSAMFPEGDSRAGMPPKQEQTVMKQAAELLEEALKEAGGSMDEVGNNPLFSAGGSAAPTASDAVEAPVAKKKSQPPPQEPKEDLSETKGETPVAKLGIESKRPAKLGSTPPHALAREAQAAAAAAKSVEPSPLTSRESPSAKSMVSAAAGDERKNRRVASAPPKAAAARAVDSNPPARKSGNGAFYIAAIVVVGAGAGLFYFKDKIFGGETTPASSAASTAAPAPPAPKPPPTASTAETASAAPSATTTASAAATTTTTATTATATPTATAATAAPNGATATATTAAPKPPPHPPATTTTTAAPPPATTTVAPKPPPPPATTTAAPPPPPPKPKPAPTSDNPY